MSIISPPATARALSPIHVFQFGGEHFVFFIARGDLLQVQPQTARALSYIEHGFGQAQWEPLLREEFAIDVADTVTEEIRELRESGLLEPQVRITPQRKEASFDRLQRHQPRNIMLFVTEACNLKCTYCYEMNQGVHDKPATLKQTDATRIIDAYFDSSNRRALTITFFGGEPLLNPKLIREVVAYAKAKVEATGQEVGFTMTSNLTLLDEPMAEFLAAEQFHVMVSIDGDRENHDRYRVTRSGEGTYDTVTRNFRMLVEKVRAAGGRLPKIRATLASGNEDAAAAERHLRSLGTHLVEIGESNGRAHATTDVDVSTENGEFDERARSLDAQAYAVVEALRADPECTPEVSGSLRQSLRRLRDEVCEPSPPRTVEPSLCGVARNMRAVTPDGDVFPCHRYVGMESFKLGNVLAFDEKQRFDREKERTFYDDVYQAFENKCAPCWLRHLCGGQCPWYLSKQDGTIVDPDTATCDAIRGSYERNLGLLAVLLRDHPDALRRITG